MSGLRINIKFYKKIFIFQKIVRKNTAQLKTTVTFQVTVKFGHRLLRFFVTYGPFGISETFGTSGTSVTFKTLRKFGAFETYGTFGMLRTFGNLEHLEHLRPLVPICNRLRTFATACDKFRSFLIVSDD